MLEEWLPLVCAALSAGIREFANVANSSSLLVTHPGKHAGLGVGEKTQVHAGKVAAGAKDKQRSALSGEALSAILETCTDVC